MIRSPHPTRVAIAAVALGLLAAACGSTDGTAQTSIVQAEAETATQPESDPATDPGTDPAADPATDPATGPDAVPEPLRFTAPLVGGGEFDGAAVADKPTVLWFWAPT